MKNNTEHWTSYWRQLAGMSGCQKMFDCRGSIKYSECIIIDIYDADAAIIGLYVW